MSVTPKQSKGKQTKGPKQSKPKDQKENKGPKQNKHSTHTIKQNQISFLIQ